MSKNWCMNRSLNSALIKSAERSRRIAIVISPFNAFSSGSSVLVHGRASAYLNSFSQVLKSLFRTSRQPRYWSAARQFEGRISLECKLKVIEPKAVKLVLSRTARLEYLCHLSFKRRLVLRAFFPIHRLLLPIARLKRYGSPRYLLQISAVKVGPLVTLPRQVKGTKARSGMVPNTRSRSCKMESESNDGF